jgi:threonine/homoserine/homoserine lactone efflux protein
MERGLLMHLLFTYIVLGFSISVPVGPITIGMTKQGLRNGFLFGWCVGLGGMTVDFIMILVIYFGFSTILSTPIIKIVMWLFGGLFLIYLAVDSFKESKDFIHDEEQNPVQRSLLKSYLSGLMVAISPGSIIFWIGIFGSILANSLNASTSNSFLYIALGILLGIIIHDIVLLSVIQMTRRFVNQNFMRWFSIGAGVVLLGFGIRFGYEFIKSLTTAF